MENLNFFIFTSSFILSACMSVYSLFYSKFSFIFWISISFYCGYFAASSIFKENILGNVDWYLDEILSRSTDPSLFILATIICGSVANFFINQFSFFRKKSSSNETENSQWFERKVSLVFYLFIVIAIFSLYFLLSNEWTYDSFVRGEFNGPGITLALMSSGAIMIPNLVDVGPRKKAICYAIGFAPALSYSVETGVRLFAAVPCATLLLTLIENNRRRNVREYVAGIVVSATIFLFFAAQLLSSRTKTYSFGDSSVPAAYITFFDSFDSHLVYDSSLYRFTLGLVSYPLARITGFTPVTTEPANTISVWVGRGYQDNFAHFPGTFFLDIWASSGFYGFLNIVSFLFLFAILYKIANFKKLLSLFILPSVFTCQYLIARGALFSAGATFSATIFWGFIFYLIINVAGYLMHKRN